MHIRKSSLIVFLALLVFFFAGWQLGINYAKNQPQTVIVSGQGDFSNQEYDNPQNVDLTLLWTVWNTLDKHYVDPDATLNDEVLVHGAVKGLVDSLEDPFTVYMTPDETDSFLSSLEGSLEGIGAELDLENGVIVVVSPLKDSPAERAGIKPGDIIYQIDGEPTIDMNFFEAIMKIRGPKGTDVTLTLIREGVDEPFEVTITRDELTIESVTHEILEGDIAYISVNQFDDTTSAGFDEAINEILLNDPNGVILDLRFNGGGYLDTSVDMASEFLTHNKEVVTIKMRDEADNETLYTTGSPRLKDIPLVVLVNEGSASASEIVAGAIQDNDRGLILGNQTFGKGTVQEIVPLFDGSSLRITIAKWFTPSDRDIDEVGITPDRIVEFSDEDIANEFDVQLEEAKKYLLNL